MKYLTILILAILIPQSPLFFAQNGKTEKFDDWFLPSKDGLNAIYVNIYLEDIGTFQTQTYYWTSSEAYATNTYVQRFSDGLGGSTAKYNNIWVRPVRSFNSTVIYSLGDKAPAGGWIYNITDLGSGNYKYYEVSFEDLETEPFSNIDDKLIGTTGTAIGTGAQNTLDIIGQTSHTSSAAKLCNDLIIYN